MEHESSRVLYVVPEDRPRGFRLRRNGCVSISVRWVLQVEELRNLFHGFRCGAPIERALTRPNDVSFVAVLVQRMGRLQWESNQREIAGRTEGE